MLVRIVMLAAMIPHLACRGGAGRAANASRPMIEESRRAPVS